MQARVVNKQMVILDAAWWGRNGSRLAPSPLHTFEWHRRLLILPGTSIEKQAEQRAAIDMFLADQKSCAGCACVVLFPAGSNRCPNSFGNTMHRLLSGIMLARLSHARVAFSTSLDCRRLLKPKLMSKNCSECLNLNRSHSRFRGRLHVRQPWTVTHFVDLLGGGSQRLASMVQGHDALDLLPPNACTSIEGRIHEPPSTGKSILFVAQEMAVLQFTSSEAARTLFALGPHVAFGALFDATFDLSPAVSPLTTTRGELRIGVHIRHARPELLGNESIEVFEPAIREALASNTYGRLRRCAILLATDRRLTLSIFQAVASRVGCRLVTSVRDAAERTYSAEHGQDTGIVLIRDLQLLATSHLLIGTWSSTLTLLAQELIAARHRRGPIPTVRYCQFWPTGNNLTGYANPRECLPAWPLITPRNESWYVSMERGDVPPPQQPAYGPMVHWSAGFPPNELR